MHAMKRKIVSIRLRSASKLEFIALTFIAVQTKTNRVAVLYFRLVLNLNLKNFSTKKVFMIKYTYTVWIVLLAVNFNFYMLS